MKRGLLPLLLSIAVLAAATLGILSLRQSTEQGSGTATGDAAARPLLVHCAAGLRKPVEQLAADFEAAYGVRVQLNYSNSGALLAQLKIRPEGDLYIPADLSYIDAAREADLVSDAIELSRFHIVLAVAPGNPKAINTLDDAVATGNTLAVGNAEASIGRWSRKHLKAADRWLAVEQHIKVEMPTVTELASAVQAGSVDAALVWDATARQFGLSIVELPEFADSTARTHAGLLIGSTNPTAALRFARYMASRDVGQKVFAEHGYETVEGDPWAWTPQVTLFSGGVNRVAIEDTLKAFEEREGCRITTVYNGCGVLVADMKAGSRPDAYFACDVSFSTQVADLFDRFQTVSETDMVILTQPGNPKQITSLRDLAKPGLRLGLADAKRSALGALTQRLLEDIAIADAVNANLKVSSGTADFLVAQLVAGEQLDAVVVYRANCMHVGDQGMVLDIDHEKAKAIQPIAAAQDTQYPRLMGRLVDALQTADSRSRFESRGFRWKAHASPAAGTAPHTEAPAAP